MLVVVGFSVALGEILLTFVADRIRQVNVSIFSINVSDNDVIKVYVSLKINVDVAISSKMK